MPTDRRRYLVFTSAGEQSCLRDWLHPTRTFDLWVTYFGVGDHPYLQYADYGNRRTGAKFPNLHYVYRTWPELMQQYDAVLVIDDDIRITGTQIDTLFALREQHDFWIMQPALDYRGKISHKVTGWQPGFWLRYTNFVELNVPLFRREVLERFLSEYDPCIVGYGIDWWYAWLLDRSGAIAERRMAVIDAVRCLNPHDHVKKAGLREIDQLQSLEIRRQSWARIRAERGIDIDERGARTLGGITLPWYHALLNRLFWRWNKQQGKRLRRNAMTPQTAPPTPPMAPN
jgi:hypothetical protein